MNVAVISGDSRIRENSIFIQKENELANWHVLLREAFRKKGVFINTIDMYTDLKQVDAFFLYDLNYVWINRIVKNGMQDKMIYCNAEPEVVKKENTLSGFLKLQQYIPFIMTWNDEWVDEKRVFKRNIPYVFYKRYGKYSFGEKKLLTNISGNKKSIHPLELYSERERAITFFEKQCPNDFDLYGTGWNVKEHPSYKGVVSDKINTYHHYRFALCLENMYGKPEYITEKIFDCFVAGIVPIYKGANNINCYVPKECYINYDDFSSLTDLMNYLVNMDEKQYLVYIDEISKMLSGNIQDFFSPERYCELLEVVLRKIGSIHLTIGMFTRMELIRKKMLQVIKDKRIQLHHFIRKCVVRFMEIL